MVFLHADLELECTKLCKYIINIIERHLKDVMLSLPVCAILQELTACAIQVRTVLFLQLVPCVATLLGGKLRIAVYNMLEFIYHCSVRNKVDGILQMHLAVVIPSFTKEQFDPWLCKKFHGHRVDFCGLHGQIT